MSRKKKHRLLPPRTLRMNQAARLQTARWWLPQQRGRPTARIARSYRKKFGVDWECAIRELTALGVVFDPAWREQLVTTLENARLRKARRREERRPAAGNPNMEESDATFAYLAGYTGWGLPYGVTWEEGRKLNPEPSGKMPEGESAIEHTNKEAWPF